MDIHATAAAASSQQGPRSASALPLKSSLGFLQGTATHPEPHEDTGKQHWGLGSRLELQLSCCAKPCSLPSAHRSETLLHHLHSFLYVFPLLFFKGSRGMPLWQQPEFKNSYAQADFEATEVKGMGLEILVVLVS